MFGILNVILVIITVSTAGTRFYNDICATVSKSSANSRVARVECHYDSIIFDPKFQNGLLFNNDTGSWTGEIFACQCSCSLPNHPENGQLLTNGRVQHGKNLEYKCDDGKKTNKIVCFDGLLMMIPDVLEDYNVTIAFRHKSLPEYFLHFHDAIFQLSVNNISDWSVHESEVSSNLKYTDILTEKDAALTYYLFNGEGFKLGTIDLKRLLTLRCGKVFNWSTVIYTFGSIAFMGVVAAILFIPKYCCPKQFERCMRPPAPTSDVDRRSQVPDEDVVPENEGNVIELIENRRRDPGMANAPLLPLPQIPAEDTPDIVENE